MTSVVRAPGSLPIVGHAVALWRDPLGFLSSLSSHGDLVEIQIGPQAVLMVCDPVLTRQVLLDDRTFDKGGPVFDRGREVLGNGLITCRHAEHRRQRRLTQPSFHRSRLAGYAEIMTRHVDEAVEAWRDGLIVDVLPSLKTIASRVITEAVFTTALSPSALEEVANDFTAFSSGVYTRMFMPGLISRLPIPSNRRYGFARTRMRRKVSDVITESRTNSNDRDDLLSVLLTARGSDTDALSEAELNDQVMTFFFAGVETTAITVAWALHFIAQHPHVEARMHAEIDTVLGGQPPSFEDLAKLEYTTSVITETLRFYPPAWLATRSTTTDSYLGTYRIPAGTVVAYSPYIIHHRGDLHPDPDTFDPDRWVARSAPRDSMIPFGGGPRKCMGDDFAVMESTLLLAGIAARWRLEPVPGRAARPIARAFLIPRGLLLRTVPRTRE